MTRHQFLGERLGRLNLRGGLGGAEYAQTALAELVDDTGCQRHLRADHGQRYRGIGGKARQVVDVGDGNGHRSRYGVDAGVAGSAVYTAHALRTLQCIDYGVLASAASYYQYVVSHGIRLMISV